MVLKASETSLQFQYPVPVQIKFANSVSSSGSTEFKYQNSDAGSSWENRNTIQNNAIQNNAIHQNTMQFNALQYNTIYIILRGPPLEFNFWLGLGLSFIIRPTTNQYLLYINI